MLLQIFIELTKFYIAEDFFRAVPTVITKFLTSHNNITIIFKTTVTNVFLRK